MTPDGLLALAREAGAPPDVEPRSAFADLFDSMGFAEFLGLVADECGVEPGDIEEAVGRRFSTIEDLARSLHEAGVSCERTGQAELAGLPENRLPTDPAWLAATAIHLPAASCPAVALDRMLGRPEGWFERRTGISRCSRWGGEDAVGAAAEVGRASLRAAGLGGTDVAALLVTSEAPPRFPGLASSLHAGLGLPPSCVALEVGGACVGFVQALWLAQRLTRPGAGVLIIAAESPSAWLEVRPGPEGETAALFADGAAACVVTATPPGRRVIDVALGCDGRAADLLRVGVGRGRVEVAMRGPALASRAALALSRSVREMGARHGLALDDLGAVVVHAGNGRMVRILARKLGVPAGRLRSRTGEVGNLGSASLPAAWAGAEDAAGPAVWAAVGAGVSWGAALLGRK
jgi:3-oxoacyl-[acyl-carrier-protein] synthase III